MKNKITAFLCNVLVGANLATIFLMLVTAYSDHFYPPDHEYLACLGMAFPFFLLANLLFIPVWVLFSWKRLLIPVVGLFMAYPSIRVYLPLHGKCDIPEKSLCVASYNVCIFGGNYKYDNAFDTIFSYLKNRQVDIVCLQEDNHKITEDYKRYYPYNDTTIVSYCTTKGYNTVGIHTRFPILRKEIINYSSRTNGSVAYFLLAEGDTIIVINNHLESSHLSKDDRNRYEEMLKGGMERNEAKAETAQLAGKLGEAMAIRAVQADSVHRYVERHSNYPIIICGDFNDTPISYVRRRMAEGMTDCYVEAGRGLGISFNRKGFYFRIDHMMCSQHFTPYACEIDDKMDASDHYPLICRLKMREKP